MSIGMDAINASMNFEKENWVDGVSVSDDPFYTPPKYSNADRPGKLLRTDDAVDGSKYLLPAGTALSRVIYLSETLKGAVVPVSAFVLWPYSPKTHSDGSNPVVAWAHGTSSFTKDGAPSHHKNLWQHFQGPFQLALNGYVVVATDYAGLGVHQDMAGNPITHPYLALPAHANDIVYSVQAAREAFHVQLSKDFVVVGHSQGGGSTWAVAERQAKKPVEGLLGCVAIAPTTRVLDEPEPYKGIIFTAMNIGMKEVFPHVDLSTIFTPEALIHVGTVREREAGVATAIAMHQQQDRLQPNAEQDEFVQRYQELVAVGGKAIGCPVLIVHGAADQRISLSNVKSQVLKTRDAFPDSNIELAILPGITHTPALTAGQRLWMDWTADRFAGRPLPERMAGTNTVVEPARPVEQFKGEQTWYLKAATEFYHVP